MMRSASRQALDALREQEQAVFGGRISADDADRRSPASCTPSATCSSPSRGCAARSATRRPRPRRASELVEQLLGGKIARQRAGARQGGGQRSAGRRPWDLTDAIETAGDDALFAAAEKDQQLDAVEDELFRFERILDSEGEATAPARRGRRSPARGASDCSTRWSRTRSRRSRWRLLHHAVASQRKRSVLLAIDDLLETAAARQERSVARVLVRRRR